MCIDGISINGYETQKPKPENGGTYFVTKNEKKVKRRGKVGNGEEGGGFMKSDTEFGIRDQE